MEFTKDSQIVKDYVLLIQQNERKLEDVPAIFNLREVVEQCLGR